MRESGANPGPGALLRASQKAGDEVGTCIGIVNQDNGVLTASDPIGVEEPA